MKAEQLVPKLRHEIEQLEYYTATDQIPEACYTYEAIGTIIEHLVKVPGYEELAKDASSKLYKFAMKNPIYLEEENHYEPDQNILDLALELHMYTEKQEQEQEQEQYYILVAEEQYHVEDIHNMLYDFADLQDYHPSDFHIDPFEAWYNNEF